MPTKDHTSQRRPPVHRPKCARALGLASTEQVPPRGGVFAANSRSLLLLLSRRRTQARFAVAVVVVVSRSIIIIIVVFQVDNVMCVYNWARARARRAVRSNFRVISTRFINNKYLGKHGHASGFFFLPSFHLLCYVNVCEPRVGGCLPIIIFNFHTFYSFCRLHTTRQ